jgi:hypothetical protein
MFFCLMAEAQQQPQIDFIQQVRNKPMSDLREYQFSRRNGFVGNFGAAADLSSAGANTITLTPCPKGLGGSDVSHPVYISGGTGTAEAVGIAGGTCTPGADTGTIEVTTANTHTGAWTVTSATAGMREACGLSGSIHVPMGTYAIHAPIVCANPTAIQGVSQGDSILACSNLLTSPMFAPTGTGEGYRWNGLTLDMTSCPSAGGISLAAQTIRPWIDGMRVIYPTGGTATGKALYLEGPGEVHVSNFIVNRAGYCVDIQGDNASGPGTENFFDVVVCDSPTISGFRILRTTAADVGAYYLTKVKITNPEGYTAHGFDFTSSVANTASVLFCTQCIADNIKGGPALNIHNQAAQHYVNSWFVSGALTYSAGHSGIRIDGTTTEINVLDVQSQGHADGLSLGDTVTSLRVVGGKYSGVDLACAVGASCAIHIDSTATLNNIDIRAPIIDQAPYTDQPEKLITQSGRQLVTYAGGVEVATLNNQGLPQMFCLKDYTAGADPTGIKCLGINALGWFEMRNSLNQDLFVVTDDGIFSLTLGHTMVVGPPPNNTTVDFGTPPSARLLTFQPTGSDALIGQTSPTINSPTLTVPSIVGAPGAESNLNFQKTGAISASNVLWRLSDRPNDKDFKIYSYDGTTFTDWLTLDYVNNQVLFGKKLESPTINTPLLTGFGNHEVLIGKGASAVASVSPGTAGKVLMSNGTGADPSFQTFATTGFSGTISVVLTVTASTSTIQYKDWANANQSKTFVDGVTYTTTNLVFVNGVLQ